MTTLVLDNPDLLAQSAALESRMPLPAAVDLDSPRKPHRSRFHYGFNKHQLNAEDEKILRAHATYLMAHPEVSVRIHGHADNFGAEEYNAFLSRLRANAAAKLLIAAGVRESRVLATGWGSTRPLARPEDHAANRRLEIEYLTQHMAKAQ